MTRNVYSSVVFTAGRPICTQILPGQGRLPLTILRTRKLETFLHDGEDRFRIPLRSLILTERQTERRTNMPHIAYTALAKS